MFPVFGCPVFGSPLYLISHCSFLPLIGKSINFTYFTEEKGNTRQTCSFVANVFFLPE
jgi:hypothetical protein